MFLILVHEYVETQGSGDSSGGRQILKFHVKVARSILKLKNLNLKRSKNKKRFCPLPGCFASPTHQIVLKILHPVLPTHPPTPHPRHPELATISSPP